MADHIINALRDAAARRRGGGPMSDTGAVERAARAGYDASRDAETEPWGDLPEWGRETFREFTSAALAAAAPTVEQVAEALYRADVPTRMDGLAGAPEWKRRDYMAKAEQVAALWGAR